MWRIRTKTISCIILREYFDNTQTTKKNYFVKNGTQLSDFTISFGLNTSNCWIILTYKLGRKRQLNISVYKDNEIDTDRTKKERTLLVRE